MAANAITQVIVAIYAQVMATGDPPMPEVYCRHDRETQLQGTSAMALANQG